MMGSKFGLHIIFKSSPRCQRQRGTCHRGCCLGRCLHCRHHLPQCITRVWCLGCLVRCTNGVCGDIRHAIQLVVIRGVRPGVRLSVRQPIQHGIHGAHSFRGSVHRVHSVHGGIRSVCTGDHSIHGSVQGVHHVVRDTRIRCD